MYDFQWSRTYISHINMRLTTEPIDIWQYLIDNVCGDYNGVLLRVKK